MIPVVFSDIQDLIGKPYAHGARGPEEYDCWGLCVEIYKRGGIVLPDYTVKHLTHAQTTALILGHAQDRADWIVTPQNWCFVFDQRDGHIGLYYRDKVIHCARIIGCIAQRLDEFKMLHPKTRFARWIE